MQVYVNVNQNGLPPHGTARALETPVMSDLSADFKALANYRPAHKVRFVTAASQIGRAHV